MFTILFQNLNITNGKNLAMIVWIWTFLSCIFSLQLKILCKTFSWPWFTLIRTDEWWEYVELLNLSVGFCMRDEFRGVDLANEIINVPKSGRMDDKTWQLIVCSLWCGIHLQNMMQILRFSDFPCLSWHMLANWFCCYLSFSVLVGG